LTWKFPKAFHRARKAPAVSPLLDIRDLVTEFETDRGSVRAVDRVSFTVAPSSTVGLVGESGCGKSVTALSIMGLVPQPPGRVAGGHILYRDRNLLGLAERELRTLRGNEISMIFQEPMTSLNPVFPVGEQVAEAVRLHQRLSRTQALERAAEMFRLVGIPAPRERLSNFPHQLSGGMRQRVMIAMALVCKPSLLIADEPTTALDVTIQAQILDLLARLQRELGMSVLLITHDLGVVAEVCEEIVVMYAGRIVEKGKTAAVFDRPRHHYTAGLLSSVPVAPATGSASTRLVEIKGSVPALHSLPVGCKFHDRCNAAQPRCREQEPELQELDSTWVRCHYPVEARP
jgi:peptide/nickel transport system ATP-binding protein